MKRFMRSLLGVSVIAMMPVIAGAAGTYYDANLYQSPQRYGSSYGANRGGYYNNYGAGRGYDQSMQNMGTSKNAAQKSKKSDKGGVNKRGFYLNADFRHEMANWDFEMNDAGSRLRYDNLTWNVLSAEGAYYFGDSTPMQLKIGLSYGKQYGESSMIDDDISNGAYDYIDYDEGRLSGYAMSIGSSKNGTQTGFNASFGLTDYFKKGALKITPSLGFRYFKHELITQNNAGLTMDVFMSNADQGIVNCVSVGGETQCDPFIGVGPFYSGTAIIVDGNGDSYYVIGGRKKVGNELSDIVIAIPGGATEADIDLGDTYYYSQAGTSHKYETTWMGPYIALDAEYAINNTNVVNAGIEFGLPVYNSKGDQPFRTDWAHPTSVEDKGSLGDAYHLGLNATWSTAISDSMMFTLGLTYDYYKVSKADATTYINQSYYTGQVSAIEDVIEYLEDPAHPGTQEQIDVYTAALAEAQGVVDYYNSKGWKEESKDEIESIYKSMGIRAGISVKF